MNRSMESLLVKETPFSLVLIIMWSPRVKTLSVEIFPSGFRILTLEKQIIKLKSK